MSSLLAKMSGDMSVLTPLEPQSRSGDNPVKFQVVLSPNGTAVLKGLSCLSGISIRLDLCPLPPLAEKASPQFFWYVQLLHSFYMELVLKYRDSAFQLHFSVNRTRKYIIRPKKTKIVKDSTFDNTFRRFRKDGDFS